MAMDKTASVPYSPSSLPASANVTLSPADEEWVRNGTRVRITNKSMRGVRTFRDPAVGIPAILVFTIVFACFLGPVVFDLQNPNVGDLNDYLLPIGTEGHILGTNHLGNDMLSRLLHGGQVSILVGLVGTGIGFGVGLVLGTAAGVLGGMAETTTMR